jgi:periplasmic divalent cation tolerance protein
MTDICFVYSTIANIEQAEDISNKLIAEGLVACVNIIPSMLSIYKWQGEIGRSEECILIFKTSVAVYDMLKTRLLEIHPYDVPCIIKINTEEVNDSYKAWLFSCIYNS